MPVPFWDVVHQDIADKRAKAGYSGAEPPGYEENEALNANPWDRLILNNALVPGVSSVRVSPRFVIDLKKKSGKDGGLIVDKGHESARVDIAITIWTPRQWENLQLLLEQTIRRAGQKLDTKDKAKAIPISHPACALWGIAAVVVESAESPEPAPEVGARIIRIRCIQYIVPNSQKVDKAVEGPGLTNVGNLAQRIRDTAAPPKTVSAEGVPARKQPTPAGGGSGL
jgi:hypothetical protein